MSSYLTNVFTDLRTVIASVWSDTKAGGIYENENLEMIPWDRLVPPFAFVIYGSVASTDDYGSQNATYLVNAHIGYVGVTTGDSGTQRDRGESLRDSLLNANLANSQVLDVLDISWDNNIEPNKYFVSKDYTHRAVVVTASILVGDTIGS